MSASTITPRQQSFIRSLIEERMDVLGITDLDAYIAEKSVNTLTGASASNIINALKAIPVGKKVEHSHLPEGRTIVNRFGKDCQLCGGFVEVGDGHAVQTAYGWQTFHAKDKCVEVTNQSRIAVESKRAYRCADNTIAIAYTTQNGRIAVRRLVVHEDGKGSLEYWRGGVAVVSATGSLLTQDEASELGKVHGFCICCCKDLSDDQSLAVGYGQTCANNNGWYYPTSKEARDILQRSTGL